MRADTGTWLTRERVVLYSTIMLLFEVLYFAVILWGVYELDIPDAAAPGWDFSVFWGASWLTNHSGAASAYDVSLIENLVKPLQHVAHTPFPTPWVYPPTFLLAVRALSLLPFAVSYVIFFGLGVVLSGYVFARTFKPVGVFWVAALAFPPVWLAALAGQNSLYTVGLAMAALALLKRSPWTAGICIGLLAIKPQLAIVFPVALLLGREWRALTAAAVTASLFCLVAGVSLGFDTFTRFFTAVLPFGQLIANHAGEWPYGMPTGFAIARHFGLSPASAYLTQAAFAVPAIALVVYLFVIPSRYEVRAAAIATATMLSQTYLLNYDLVWLALPIAFLTTDGVRHGWLKGDQLVLVTAWVAPVVFFFPPNVHFGLCMPLVMVAIMAIIFRRSRFGAELTHHANAHGVS